MEYFPYMKRVCLKHKVKLPINGFYDVGISIAVADEKWVLMQ